MRIVRLLPLSAVLLLVPHPVLAEGSTRCCAARLGQAEFADRVHEYVDLHSTLAAASGPEAMCGDPEQLYRANAALARAIRAARSTARTGDVFTPRAAPVLRAMLSSVVGARYDVQTLLDDMDREGLQGRVDLEVNGDFPWTAGNVMPPALLRVLPHLPPELEYRFVRTDLVLLDVRANLIVDVLENALPAPTPVPHDHTSPEIVRPDTDVPTPHQPCDVHPEMPGCWM